MALNSYNIFKSLFTRMKDNNMSDFSINEMQEMQKAGKMRTEKQKTGIVWDSHRRTKVKNRKLHFLHFVDTKIRHVIILHPRK